MNAERLHMFGMAEKKPKKKKKSTGGAHKTDRSPMMLPDPWDAVVQDLASEDGQPKLWYVIKLIKQAAEAKGKTNLPTPPWDKQKPPPATEPK
jgi:hypothetical protein